MKKILLIDDDENLKDNIAEILYLSDYNVITAKNGKEGVEKAIRENPGLILCDILMPGLDGYGVLYILRKHPETNHIPFIFITAKCNATDFRKGLGMGADDYLIKPFDEIELLNTVKLRLTKAQGKYKGHPLNSLSPLLSIIGASINEGLDGHHLTKNVLKLQKNQVLYRAGQIPNEVYYVISGKLKEFKLHEYGKILITNIYQDDDLFGYHAIITKTDHSETVQTMEATELLVITKEQFLELLNNNSDFTLQLVASVTKELQTKQELLLKMAYSSLRKKVAAGIITITNLHKSASGEKSEVDLTREDLAHLIGSASESLIRTLKEFKNEKLIDIKDGHIILLNKDKLKNLIY